MSTDNSKPNGISAPGRSPPPAENRFKRGRFGNARGRPKGAVRVTALTKQFALGQIAFALKGKRRKLSRLEIAVIKLQALAAEGKPAAAELLNASIAGPGGNFTGPANPLGGGIHWQKR